MREENLRAESNTHYTITHLPRRRAVPAHVHLDPHGNGFVGQDSYENYITDHYNNWTADDGEDYIQEAQVQSLDELFYKLAKITKYFPSDAVNGTTSDIPVDTSSWPNTEDWRYWNVNEYEITEGHVNTIGNYLMPRSLSDLQHGVQPEDSPSN